MGSFSHLECVARSAHAFCSPQTRPSVHCSHCRCGMHMTMQKSTTDSSQLLLDFGNDKLNCWILGIDQGGNYFFNVISNLC